jgi:AraC family transcriptional regulator
MKRYLRSTATSSEERTATKMMSALAATGDRAINGCWVAPDNTQRITDFFKVTGASSRFVALTVCEAPEHEHPDIQITTPFFSDVITARWHTARGESCQRIVRAGECCVIPSGQPHRFNWRGSAEIANLYLETSWLEQISDEAYGRSGWYLPEDYCCQDPVLLQLGAALREAYGRPAGPARLLVEGMAAVVAMRLLRRRTTGQAMPTRTDKLSPHSVRRALDYIHSHLGEDLSLHEIAAVARYSPFHFARAFKTATGLSPHCYVMQERIEQVKRRLRGSDDSICQICMECGFVDQSHCTRLFRRETGMTPRLYRQQAKV